ncbi:unnamed protein product, partial [marine sediment metagenome]
GASPTRTWFGGICCVLKACRSKDRTIIIRVKEVTRINIAGARVRRVIRRII